MFLCNNQKYLGNNIFCPQPLTKETWGVVKSQVVKETSMRKMHLRVYLLKGKYSAYIKKKGGKNLD